MTDGDNKELIGVLKRIEEKLGDIKYDLSDIKREMPKVPYYGDLLQDMVKAIENLSKQLTPIVNAIRLGRFPVGAKVVATLESNLIISGRYPLNLEVSLTYNGRHSHSW